MHQFDFSEENRVHIQNLQKVTQLLKLIKVSRTEPQPSELEYSMHVNQNGIWFEFGKTVIEFDFRELTISFSRTTPRRGPTDGDKTQNLEKTVDINNKSINQVLTATDKNLPEEDLKAQIDLEKIETDLDESLIFDAEITAQYTDLLWKMYQTLALFKSKLPGAQTPLVLWPHGFDLSTIWFADGTDEKKDPHMNFGFSPDLTGSFEPYFYFYLWPADDKLRDNLPEIVEWHEDWANPGGKITLKKINELDLEKEEIADVLYETWRLGDLVI